MKQREKSVDILSGVFWTVQPPMGLIKGDYYQSENWFAPHYDGDEGYHGVLEVVAENGRLLMVEFNEFNSSSYYIRMFQNVSKRRSGYGFFQATKARTAVSGVVLVNGLCHVEAQMLKENRLAGEFDLLTGASNSVKRSLLPLAEELAPKIGEPSGVRYYGLAEPVQNGLVGRLQVEVADGRILSSFFDEIFADCPEDIDDPELKPYYRQSKYNCLEYVSTAGIGFNNLSDLARRQVAQKQCLTDLAGLPFTEGEKRAVEWDHYLQLAQKLEKEMQADGLL